MQRTEGLRWTLPRVGGRPVAQVTTDSAPAVDGETATDAELVALAQRDRAAFAPLHARYAPVVLGYCRRRLGDPEAAADATSQVFVQVLNVLPRCRGESFRAWLFGIAHNVTTDHLRARAVRNGRDAAFNAALDRPDGGPSLEAFALAREGEESVRLLMAHLPPDQRAIVELRLAGLTGVEIAQALGKRPGAVRIAQLRAYRRLRELIGPTETDELPADLAIGKETRHATR